MDLANSSTDCVNFTTTTFCVRKLRRFRLLSRPQSTYKESFQFVVADFTTHFFVAVIHRYANILCIQFFGNLLGIFIKLLTYGENDSLLRVSQSGIFQTVCSINTATKRSMEPNGARESSQGGAIVFAGVFQFESFR